MATLPKTTPQGKLNLQFLPGTGLTVDSGKLPQLFYVVDHAVKCALFVGGKPCERS